ncbi:acyltransferase [Carboxylicivirga sp. A043]|uniref:acyltransferase family protein n=1 Tax=Carboxylicivirga litoralis TaxID=2816963 RepID=UPI0021CB701B|nr:acyltransferase [Carboxylicivirga sp. A043]MCU4154569.1 acyltransferase [Carboxylicivirga sp. A043]
METTERRYDIDWLRVIAIGLLLIYHAAIVFQPWGILIRFIQSNESLEWLWIPMSMMNVWRIPLLFLVSGMGVCFAIRKRSWKQLIGERSRRILLPFVAGVALVVPLHELIWQNHYSQPFSYALSRGHLWFLGNIFAYVILLLPLFYYLKVKVNTNLYQRLTRLMSHPFSVLLLGGLLVAETLWVSPESYEMYALTWHGFYLGILAFAFGFVMAYVGNGFWKSILKWRWLYAGFACCLFMLRLLVFDLFPPKYLYPFETMTWIYAVLGFGYKYLNQPGKWLSYLSKAAYPVYILHMIFLYAGAAFILPINLPVELKFVLVTLCSLLGSVLVYELLIKRVKYLGLFFGYTPASAKENHSVEASALPA